MEGTGGEGDTERRLGVRWVSFALCLWMTVTVDTRSVGRLSADEDHGQLQ